MAIKSFVASEVLTAADTNTFLANSGLVFVKSQTIGAGVGSVTVTSAFSSTYDNYRIIVSGTVCSANADVTFQLSSITTSVYSYQGYYQLVGNATLNGYGSASATTMAFGTPGTTGNSFSQLEISAPNLAVTKYANLFASSALISVTQGAQIISSVQSTGFTLAPTSGTMTGGTITVYGYRKG
jgi:hypothetical protein